MPKGIDVAGDSGAFIPQIKAANLDFVVRYYRRSTSHFPALSASEARLLSSHGLQVAAVWEAASDHSGYFSRLSGLDDGSSAYHQANQIRQPAGSTIYFAVDFDASATDMAGGVGHYFQGVQTAFNAANGAVPDYKVGVYGSGAVCEALLKAGLVEFTWLAMSTGWAGYNRFKGWNIKQGRALRGLPFDHDSDEAPDNFGSFQVS